MRGMVPVRGVVPTRGVVRVGSPSIPQLAVYEDSVQPLLHSCLDGYNVTVLAYGQTGSGKSFTMGSEDTLGILTSEGKGSIPR